LIPISLALRIRWDLEVKKVDARADLGDPLSIEPWNNAIRELHRVSLLRSEGESIYPTLAALTFARLLETWA
jgi:hypothetical protein